MKFHILYGSSTGTAEGAAFTISSVLSNHNIDVQIDDMMDYSADDFTADEFYVFVCATYGDGEYPATAEILMDDLAHERPDLAGVRFAVFGLGDWIYESTFNNASTMIVRDLTALGAELVGEVAKHDNSGDGDVNDAATAWAEALPVAARV